MDAVTEIPRQPDSWVRCLGWQNLEFTTESLSAAVVSTLVALSMPYTVVESAGQLGMTFVVYPIEPDARELMPDARSFSARGLRIFVAGFKLIPSIS